MIFPILDGFFSYRKAPVTWLILLANIFLFQQNQTLSSYSLEEMKPWFQDDRFLDTQGRVYLQYLGENHRGLASLDDKTYPGQLAFLDEEFLQTNSQKNWLGDSVAIAEWSRGLQKYLGAREIYPAFMFGVSHASQSFFSYLSYQFYHEDFMHLFGNLLLIFLLGGFLEKRHGGLLVFLIFLASGCLSAYFYTFFLGANAAPLIGASGSLCGLLGFLMIVHSQTRTRLMYFILPIEGYYGFFKLKTIYWVFWLCMLEDVSGWFSRSQYFTAGVSHFVHLGGFLVGCGLGLVFIGTWKSPEAPKPIPHSVGPVVDPLVE